jgi:hypothetical protein
MVDIYNMSDADRQSHAVVAAHQAAEAVTELLRFSREGADINGTFGDIEVVEKLLDAAKMAIECLTEDDDGQRYMSIYRQINCELEFWV